jgi:hypothetical protein
MSHHKKGKRLSFQIRLKISKGRKKWSKTQPRPHGGVFLCDHPIDAGLDPIPRRPKSKIKTEKINRLHETQNIKRETRVISDKTEIQKSNSKSNGCGRKGCLHSKETKIKMSETQKAKKHLVGTRWFTNGTKQIRAFECPEGFVPGRKIQ